MLLAWSTRGREKPWQLSLSPDRGGRGPPPLGVYEQASLAATVTLEGTIEEGIVSKHKLLLLSLPWEHIHPAPATAKYSRHCLNIPEANYHFPGPATRSSLCHLSAGAC